MVAKHPELVLCAKCETFHPCPKKRHNFCIKGVDCPLNKQGLSFCQRWGSSWWNLHMCARPLGPDAAYDEDYPRPSKPWVANCGVWTYMAGSKRIDGRLLIQVSASKRLHLDRVLEGTKDMPGCKHLRGRAAFEAAMRKHVLKFTAAGGSKTHSSPLYRCVWCPTEIRFTFETANSGTEAASGQPEQYKCTVITYTDVGACESPMAREW